MPMVPEIKVEYLKALRSGEYKQTQGALFCFEQDGPTYCCLGVLCEIQKPKVWLKDMSAQGLITATLPSNYRAGLSPDQMNHLAYLNDSKKYSFIEIADFVERNY